MGAGSGVVEWCEEEEELEPGDEAGGAVVGCGWLRGVVYVDGE